MFVNGKFVDCDLFLLLEVEVTKKQRKDVETYENGINKHTALLIKVCSV